MGKVNVVIVDATGNKEQRVGLPDDIKCGIIMVKLVEKIKLPSVGPDGNPISYKFIHKVTGRQLLEAQTLGEAGIKDGDVLRLQPEITAGAFCANCGGELQDGVAFCAKCGAAIQTEQNVQNNCNNPHTSSSANVNNAAKLDNAINVINEKSKGGILFNVIGLLSGILSAILGFVVFGLDTGSWENPSSYGGDAYTGIQNAAAQTANNVQDLTEIIKFGVASLLIIVGIAIFCYFGAKLSSNVQKKVN